jgi:hypothetical protein
MKKNSLALMIAAAFCSAAITAAAQTAGGAPAKTGAPEKVRLTGCIERADQLMGNGSTTGTSVDSMDLVLMKARPASEGQTANADAKATGTSGGSTGVGKMYRLSADTVKANPHVGHQVEISGSIQTAGPGVAPGAPAAPAADKSNPSAADAPMLKVDSLRMISETCPK